jgi:hypothetical protein
MNIKYLLTTITLLILINIIGNILAWSMPDNNIISKTDCFDRRNNKIIGQVCESIELGASTNQKITLTILIFVFSLIILMPALRSAVEE